MRSAQLTRNIKARKANNKNTHFKRSALYMGMCLASQLALAGPEGGAVVGGSGSINQNGSTTTILQTTDRMAIDWQSYDVAADERVQYIQPDSSSVSLNRILSNYGSTIHGRIDANGQVILVNPNGIFFSESSVVNAGGILASGLRLDPSNFMNGDFTFRALEGDEGVVINSGLLQAATGGSVNLLGKRVENNGLIQAELGTVSLAAGKEAVLHFDQGGLLGIQVTESILQEELGLDAAVLNNGEIEAAGGKVLLSAAASRDVFSSAVNMGEGVATSVVVEEDGSFTLSAGANVENRGSVNVSATGNIEAGEVAVLGQNIDQRGSINADAEVQTAGRIELQAVDTTLVHDGSTLSARSEKAEGGNVYVFGNQVALLGASSVSVSAARGAGEILIGGDYRGENPRLPNASAAYFGPDALLNANATDSGTAGKIILWGDNLLRAYGAINARGFGSANGGFVETSSAQVDLDLFVNVNSINANSGEWLIDPYDIIIDSSNTRIDTINNDGDSQFDLFQPSAGALDTAGNASILNVSTLRNALDNGNTVTIQTTREGGDGGDANGDITLNAALNFDGREGSTLNLVADGNIIINAQISDSSPSAGSDSIRLSFIADAAIDVNANIVTQGGWFTAQGASFDSTGRTINTSASSQGGDVTITTAGDASLGTFTVNGSTTASISIGGIVTVTSGGVINLNAGFDFSYTGNVEDDQTYTLTLLAADGINILGEIHDSISGDRDSLNLDFQADTDSDGVGDLIISEDIYTGGGNVVFSGANFSNTGFVINTDNSNNGTLPPSTNNGISDTSNGGSVQITMSGDVTIQNITTDADGFEEADIAITGNNITVNGTIDSQAGDFVLRGNSGENTFTINSTASVSGSGARYINDSVASTRGGDDTFNIYADIGATIAGGADNDIFNIYTSLANTITGDAGEDTLNIGFGNAAIPDDIVFTFDGGADDDTVSIENTSYNTQWELTGADTARIANVDGGFINLNGVDILIGSDTSGNDLFNITGAFEGEINGRAGTDEIQLNTTEGGNWVVTGTDSGTLNTNLLFAGIESLLGSNDAATGNDLFDFEFVDGGVIGAFAGTINARDGDDAVNVTYDDPLDINDIFNVDVDLGSLDFNGVTNAENLLGGGDNTSLTITGGAASGTNTTWTVDGDNSGSVENTGNEVTFLEFGNLIGNIADDIFNVTGSIISVSGGTGADSLQGRAAASTYSLEEIDVNGDGSLLLVGGSVADNNAGTYVTQFTEIETLNGGLDSDTLQARDVANTWNITVNEGGSISGDIAFTEMEFLTGGLLVDEFFISASSTSILNGAGGSDIYRVSASGVQVAINDSAGTGDALYAYDDSVNTNTWALVGQTNNTLTNNANIVTFSNIESLFGSNNATIGDVVNVTGTFDGSMDGRAGTDELWLNTAAGGAWAITGTDEGTLNTDLAFAGFESLFGSDGGNDQFDFEFLNGAGDGIGVFNGTINARGGDFDSVNLLFGAITNVEIDLSGSLNLNGVQNAEVLLGGGTGTSLTVTGVASGTTTTWNIFDFDAGGSVSEGTNDGSVANSSVAGSFYFLNFAELIGNVANDFFNVTGTVGTVTGGGGNDTLRGRDSNSQYNLTAPQEGNVQSGSTTYANFIGIENLVGGSGTDTMQGRNLPNSWNITGSNLGSVDGVDFSGMENLRGGSAIDEFIFGASGSISGSIDGAGHTAGGDIANYSAVVSPVVSLLSGLLNIESVIGNPAGSTLVGANNTQTWRITALDATAADGVVGGITFSDFTHLAGGSSTDTLQFDIAQANYWDLTGSGAGTFGPDQLDQRIGFSFFENLTGGGGDDLFRFNTGVTTASFGTIDGGLQTTEDTADFSGQGTAITLGEGGLVQIERLVGNGAGSSIQGPGVSTIWDITDINTGTATFGSTVTAFSGFGTLNGGVAEDTFNFGPTGAITVLVNGGLIANNTINGRIAAGTYTLTGTNSGRISESGTTYLAGFQNIQRINGSAVATDILQASNDPNTWNLNGDGVGTINGLGFTDFETLQGGTGIDNFTTNALTYSFTLAGGNSNPDTLTYSGSANALWTLTSASAGNLETTLLFSGIETLVGGSGVNRLQARDNNAGNTWSITGSGSGSVDGRNFQNMDFLLGGALNDNFDTNSLNHVVTIEGNDGANSLTFSGNAAATWTLTDVNQGNLANNLTFSEIQTLNGGPGTGANVDTLRAPNTDNVWAIDGTNTGVVAGTRFNSMDNLTGGSLNDVFGFDVVGLISGTINGGAGSGSDILQGRAAATSYLLTNSEAGTATVGSTTYATFSEIENIEARGENDVLRGRDVSNIWTINGVDAVSIDGIAFTAVENLTGGSQTDTFIFSTADASISGLVNGAGDSGGNDSIRGRDTGNLFVITGDGSGNVEQSGSSVAGFVDIEELIGGSGNDTLQAQNVDTNWEITGSNEGTVARSNNDYEFDFSGMENLTGTGSRDTFTFSNTTSEITGLVNAGEGTNDNSTHDQLILSGLVPGVVVSVGDTVTPGIVIFDSGPAPTQVNASNFETIIAPSRTNRIDEANYWLAINYLNAIDLQITGSTENNNQNINHGYLDLLDSGNQVLSNSSINFENFGSIQSGDGSFTSNVRPRILSNGSIQTSYNITGRFQEGDGASNPNFSGEDISVFIVVEVTDKLESVTGNGNTLLLVNRDHGTMNFNLSNTWTITGVNEGTFGVDAIPDHSVAFSGVNQLAGGGGGDQFNFINSGTLVDGSIFGGGGINTIASASSVALTFGVGALENVVPDIARPDYITSIDRLANRAGIIDILNISTLTGNSAVGVDTVLYSSDATGSNFTWTIGGANTVVNNGSGASLSFANIDRVVGGAANDTFNVLDLSAMEMNFDGGAGDDLLNLGNFSQAFVISLDTAIPADVWVNGVETLTLPNQAHSLYAAANNNTWTFTGENTGTLAYNDGADQLVNFTNVAHVIGSSLQDNFIFDTDGRVTGTLDGGADNGFDIDTLSVNSTNVRDFVFQVGSIDVDGRVIDTDSLVVDFLGIEDLSANAARTNTLIAANVGNAWLISDAGNSLTYSGATLDFIGISNLRGGSAQDNFTFDGAIVDGLVDAAGNVGNQGDSLLVQDLDGTTVHIGNRVSTDLNVSGFESYTAVGNNLILRADDVANTWNVNSANGGLINGAQFGGFSSLVGGFADDNFVFGAGGTLAGLLDGGANPANGVANDILDLQALVTPRIVSLDPTYSAADLFIVRVESVSATGPDHTLVGADANNSWLVTEPDTGQLNGMNFSGFANLLGRDQVDTFTFRELGDITGLVDGGSQPQNERDIVNMSELTSAIQVLVGDSTSGFVDIEEYIGNNVNASIVGESIENTWTIDAVNGGTISDALGRNIAFRDFTSIVGGAAIDRFTITETGSVTGQILAGGGADRLTVMLGSGRNGEVNFVGGEGADTVAVEGGSLETRFAATYRAAAGDAAAMDFAINDLDFGLNYSGTETVNNTAYISTLTVNPVSGQANTVQLTDTAFTVGGHAPVNFTRVQSFVLNGAQGDALVVSGLVDFENNIELRSVTVDASAGSLRAGQNLIFDRTGALGTQNDRLQIEAANLTLNRVGGAAYLDINGNVNLAALTSPVGAIDILSNAAVASTAELQSTQALNIVAGGDIRLSGLNNLSGAVSFVSPDTVELNNSATNLAGVQAGNFILTARSLVDDNGAMIIDEQFTLNGAVGSVVTLDHAQNSFSQIVLNSEGSVLLRDHSVNGVNVQGRAENGLDLLVDQAIIASDLSGSNISLVSTNAALSALGAITADNLVRLHGNGVQVSGLVSVSNSAGNQAVDINAGTGNVNLLAGINAAQTISGDVVVAGANVTTGDGADISARNIQVAATGNINMASDLIANEVIHLNAAGNIVMQNASPRLRMQGQTINLDAGTGVQLQDVTATQLNVSTTLGDILQQGNVTVTSDSNFEALQGAINSALGAVLRVDGSSLNIVSASMQWLGDILAPQATANVAVNGAIELGGDLQFADATISAGNQLAMSGGSSISSSTNLDITTGADLQVAALTAGDTLTLDIGGAVTNNDSQATNLTAPNLIAVSQTGFGSFANAVETAVSLMDVVNTTGEIGVTNTQELGVNALITSGDIFLQNTQGNVTLNNLAEADYQLGLTGTRAAGGVIDANYDLGDVRIEVLTGYLSASPQVSHQDRPELIGNSVSVVTRDGFGVRGRRIVVLAKDQLRVGGVNGGGGGIRPRWGLGIPPANGLITDSDLADVGVFGSLADLFIEFAGEIDPAIFTNVTNYVYEDVSIRMPRDQLLEDEEDKDEEEEWQRLEGSDG